MSRQFNWLLKMNNQCNVRGTDPTVSATTPSYSKYSTSEIYEVYKQSQSIIFIIIIMSAVSTGGDSAFISHQLIMYLIILCIVLYVTYLFI